MAKPAAKVIQPRNIEQALAVFLEKLEVVQQFFREDSTTRNNILSEETGGLL